jgi:hypothetical protein
MSLDWSKGMRWFEVQMLCSDYNLVEFNRIPVGLHKTLNGQTLNQGSKQQDHGQDKIMGGQDKIMGGQDKIMGGQDKIMGGQEQRRGWTSTEGYIDKYQSTNKQ